MNVPLSTSESIALIIELIENYFPFQGGWRGEGDMPVHTTVDTIQRGI